MSKQNASELDAGWTMRCGRCADILPDETLSFCPACGIPFSRVPPTNQYSHLAERATFKEAQKKRRVFAFTTATLFAALWGLAVGISMIDQNIEIKKLKATREIVVFNFDVPGYPKLDPAVRRLGIAVAQQAFEDHFGFPLKEIQIRESNLPAAVDDILRQNWQEKFTRLSFWEKDVLLRFASTWGSSMSNALPVIITNVPLFVDGGPANHDLETRHLSHTGIISGIGSPGFVLVSTFRMLSEDKKYLSARPVLKNDSEKSRYLGEYLIAHELGHALLGLPDYVTTQPKMQALRQPASFSSTSECLMHTDEGGGAQAWENLRNRKLGQSSACSAYLSSIKAYALRAQAIGYLKQGRRVEAESRHTMALLQIGETANPWTLELWRQEHKVFLSVFSRWWSGFSVIQ